MLQREVTCYSPLGVKGLRPHQLGIAQIMAFNFHMERYNDSDKALLWKVAAITK